MFETHFIYSAVREKNKKLLWSCFFLHSTDRLIRFSLKMYYKWNLIVDATWDADWFKTRHFALFLTFSFLIIIIVSLLTASIVIGSWKQKKKYNPPPIGMICWQQVSCVPVLTCRLLQHLNDFKAWQKIYMTSRDTGLRLDKYLNMHL